MEIHVHVGLVQCKQESFQVKWEVNEFEEKLTQQPFIFSWLLIKKKKQQQQKKQK